MTVRLGVEVALPLQVLVKGARGGGIGVNLGERERDAVTPGFNPVPYIPPASALIKQSNPPLRLVTPPESSPSDKQ